MFKTRGREFAVKLELPESIFIRPQKTRGREFAVKLERLVNHLTVGS